MSVTITVMSIKGMNTMIHETIPKPLWHKMFNNKVIKTITITLTMAVLYKPLNESMTIWVKENNKYINAGGHKLEKVNIFSYLYYQDFIFFLCVFSFRIQSWVDKSPYRVYYLIYNCMA